MSTSVQNMHSQFDTISNIVKSENTLSEIVHQLILNNITNIILHHLMMGIIGLRNS